MQTIRDGYSVRIIIPHDDEARLRKMAASDAMYHALKRCAEGWANAIEMGIIPPQHVTSASILRDEARAALRLARGETTDG